MATDIKALSRRIFEEVWNKQSLSVAEELIAANFVDHDPQSSVQGIEGYKQFVRYYLTAFPDSHFTVEDEMADGQMVVTRWTVTGTHTGNLGAIPPTGRRISITGTSWARVENGKLVEGWTNWDTLGLMQQLGILAATAQQAA